MSFWGWLLIGLRLCFATYMLRRFLKYRKALRTVREHIATFETGCSIGGHLMGAQPEDCPECVREFVKAVKRVMVKA
jgi:hypothetical protein